MMIKLFDYQHNYIDTLTEFNKPQSTDTLNGVNKFTFSVPLNASKTNPVTMRLGNHLEFFYNAKKVWWGIIVNTNFKGGEISVGCYGYAHLLEHRRLTEREYPLRRYNELLGLMLEDVNNVDDTMIRSGKMEVCEIKTQRTTHESDFCFKKMVDYANDINAYLSIDDELKLNFLLSIPQTREYYARWTSDELCNITTPPTLDLDLTSVANDIYGELSVYNSETSETDKHTYRLKDEESIKKYGVHHGVAKTSSGVSELETFHTIVKEELETNSNPSVSISLDIVDTILAPLDELKVGHSITVQLEPYFDYKSKSRILEINRNYTENTAKITVGSTLYRPTAPSLIFYKQ